MTWMLNLKYLQEKKMNLTKNERKELDALSLEVFGSSSRWQKLVNNGAIMPVMEKKIETVPGTETTPETTTEVEVPVLRADGAHQSTIIKHTPESVKAMMIELKIRREKILAMIDAQQKEQKAKEEKEALQKKVQEELGGSAT